MHKLSNCARFLRNFKPLPSSEGIAYIRLILHNHVPFGSILVTMVSYAILVVFEREKNKSRIRRKKDTLPLISPRILKKHNGAQEIP